MPLIQISENFKSYKNLKIIYCVIPTNVPKRFNPDLTIFFLHFMLTVVLRNFSFIYHIFIQMISFYSFWFVSICLLNQQLPAQNQYS